MTTFRIGHGYDVHRLEEGRALILCGIEIPYEKGLLGHSDADVALHALMDSLLGAAGLNDIGYHFPDKDEKYRGVSSLTLLGKVKNLLNEKGYTVLNCDLTIVCERPYLRPHIDKMRENIAKTLEIPTDKANVKATTMEGLGFEGEGKGLSATALCVIDKA